MVNFIEIREWCGRHFEPRTVVVHPNRPRLFLLILAKPASKKEVQILDNVNYNKSWFVCWCSEPFCSSILLKVEILFWVICVSIFMVWWDSYGVCVYVAVSPREFHETDNSRTNSAALLATWQHFSFRHIKFSKLSPHQKLSQIILSYFSNALSFEQGKRCFQISGKLSSFAKITNKKKMARHFENHYIWRAVTLVVISRPKPEVYTACGQNDRNYFTSKWRL